MVGGKIDQKISKTCSLMDHFRYSVPVLLSFCERKVVKSLRVDRIQILVCNRTLKSDYDSELLKIV